MRVCGSPTPSTSAFPAIKCAQTRARCTCWVRCVVCAAGGRACTADVCATGGVFECGAEGSYNDAEGSAEFAGTATGDAVLTAFRTTQGFPVNWRELLNNHAAAMLQAKAALLAVASSTAAARPAAQRSPSTSSPAAAAAAAAAA